MKRYPFVLQQWVLDLLLSSFVQSLLIALSILLFFSSICQTAFSQDLQWVQKLGNNNFNTIESIIVDDQGNAYATGIQSREIAILADGPSEIGRLPMIFVKLSPDGNLLWSFPADNEAGDILGKALACSPDGNIILAGTFSDTIDFDPGPDRMELKSVEKGDMFFAKYSPDGGLIWVKQIGSGTVNGLVVNETGEIFLAGKFNDTLDLDPDLLRKDEVISNPDNDAVFIARYSSEGNLIWGAAIQGEDDVRGGELAIDKHNDLYIAGRFNGRTDFDPALNSLSIDPEGLSNGFLLKYDFNQGDSASLVWLQQIPSPVSSSIEHIAIDQHDNLHAYGRFEGQTDFDPSDQVHILQPNKSEATFLSKYNAEGELLWVNQLEAMHAPFPGGLTVDSLGQVYIGGVFTDSLVADISQPQNINLSHGIPDLFFAKFDQNGDFLLVETIGGTSTDVAMAIASDDQDNIWLGGFFKESVDFDPGAGETVLTSSLVVNEFLEDAFVGKYNTSLSPITCNITDIQIPTGLFTAPTCEGGSGYIIPTAPEFGTYFACFDIIGEGLPPENDQYKIVIEHIEYPVIVSQYTSPEKVTLCVRDLPDNRTDLNVFVRLAEDCSFNAIDLYDAPNCEGFGIPDCDITNISVSSGPDCNGDTYDICFFVEGVGLPDFFSNTKIVTDHIEREIKSINPIEGGWEVCVDNIPADGVRDIEVFFKANFECSYTGRTVYDEPSCARQRLANSGHQLVEIYPNPTTDFLILKTGLIEAAELRIFNQLNQTVLTKKLERQSGERIDIRELPKGIYFIQIDGIGFSSSKKVLKLN